MTSGILKYLWGTARRLVGKITGKGKVSLRKDSGSDSYSGDITDIDFQFIQDSELDIDSIFNVQGIYDSVVKIDGTVSEINGWCNKISVGSAENLNTFFSTVSVQGDDEVLLTQRVINRMNLAFNQSNIVHDGSIPWKTLISNDVYSKFNEERGQISYIKQNLDEVKKAVDLNKLVEPGDGSSIPWLIRNYAPVSVSGVSHRISIPFIVQQFLRSLEQFYSDSFGFTADKVIPEMGFTTVNLMTLKGITEYLGIAYANTNKLVQSIPENLSGLLANIQMTAANASGSAGMASQYSQSNSSKLDSLKADVDLLKVDVSTLKQNITDIDLILREIRGKLVPLSDETLPSIQSELSALHEEFTEKIQVIDVTTGNAAIHAHTAAVNSSTCVTQNANIQAAVNEIGTDIDGLDVNLGDLKQSISRVGRRVDDVGQKIDDNDLENVSRFGWVVQCCSCLINRIFLSEDLCFGDDILTISAGKSYSSLVPGVSFGVVDVPNLTFSCPDIQRWWPYRVSYGDEIRFVSEDMPSSFSFYYFPVND